MSTKFRLKYDSVINSTFINHLINYPAPLILKYSWSFGFTLGILLVIQILSGFILTMHYVPNVEYAFNSIEYFMRDVSGGWFIRYTHSNGASLFFLFMYFHIFRGLLYSSFSFSKLAVWYSGIAIFFLSMLTGFIGYVLPWGQMSYWGATVITNLITVIPYVGTFLVYWIWGNYIVENSTLNRFFSLHFILPLIIGGLVLLHLYFLHKRGSTNPMNVDNDQYIIKFYPYYITKDLFFIFLVLFLLVFLVCFEPNLFSHPDNYIKANPLKTPPHIVPEWYFLAFYGILRSVPNKTAGVILMVFAIFIFLFFPIVSYYKTSKSLIRHNLSAKSYNYVKYVLVYLLLIVFLLLMFVGSRPAESIYIPMSWWLTIMYFTLIVLLLILDLRYEKIK